MKTFRDLFIRALKVSDCAHDAEQPLYWCMPLLQQSGGTGTVFGMDCAGYGPLLLAFGMRSPGECMPDPCSVLSSCSAGSPGLTQTLVTWDFGVTLAADTQRYFGVKCMHFRRMGLWNLILLTLVAVLRKSLLPLLWGLGEVLHKPAVSLSLSWQDSP